jgi:hypothetical protein
MIITQDNRKVVSSHNFDSVNCTIDAEDMRYVASLLRNNYSNTQLAVVREVSANALDANAEANASRPIEIKVPTSMNPTFAVRDFGGGLSEEDVFGLYSKYGKSTKRESNNYIGAFGIGKFAPLSYGDNFTCVSCHNGKKATYNIFVNEDDDTKISRIGDPVPTNEPTGLSIEVAVADNDINSFTQIVQEFFTFFSDDEMPKFIGVEEDFITKPKNLLASKTDNWFFVNVENNYYRSNAQVIMGRVAYKLDPHSVQVENYISDENYQQIAKQLLTENSFYLRVPLGSVKLHHSRESLEYNKSTQKELCRLLYLACKDIQVIAKEKLQDSTCLWNAKMNYAQVVNALPYQMKRVFENSFEWEGIKISSPSFGRDYKYHDDLIITRTEKEEDSSSRNGFKLKSCKTNSIYCTENTLVLIQDLESAHGNNLRVRTLMNEDDSLKEVYTIRPKNKDAEDYLWEIQGLNFYKVSKKLIKFTSNVEKEKIVRNKVSGNKSRASIALFKMTTDKGYSYRNADYWQNVDNPINSLELDNVEGSIDGKLVYVPIKNYKIDNEGFDLDKVYGMYKGVRNSDKDNTERKNLVLFGVRTSDVKKLDDDIWVSFFDLYLDICKQIVEENRAVSDTAHKKFSLQDANTDLSNHHYDLGHLFENGTLDIRLSDDHIFNLVKNDFKLLDFSFESGTQKIVNALNYVRTTDKEWIEENFDTYNSEVVNNRVKDLKSKYPLLVVIGKSINGHWTQLDSKDEAVTNKMIRDYISLCDGVGN